MKIDFDEKHIVLAISNSIQYPKNRLEFRTRGMLVLGYIVLDEDVNFMSLSLLSVKVGWLLGQKKNKNHSRLYTFIDNDLHEHKQNLLSTNYVESIAFVEESNRTSVLALYRKRNGVQLSTKVNNRFILDLYEIPK